MKYLGDRTYSSVSWAEFVEHCGVICSLHFTADTNGVHLQRITTLTAEELPELEAPLFDGYYRLYLDVIHTALGVNA